MVSERCFGSACLIISDVEAVTTPADSTFLSIFQRVDQRTHSLAISAIRFHEIDKMEAVCLVFPSILDAEEVPLSVTMRAVIVFQIKFIFKLAHFYGFSKVA